MHLCKLASWTTPIFSPLTEETAIPVLSCLGSSISSIALYYISLLAPTGALYVMMPYLIYRSGQRRRLNTFQIDIIYPKLNIAPAYPLPDFHISVFRWDTLCCYHIIFFSAAILGWTYVSFAIYWPDDTLASGYCFFLWWPSPRLSSNTYCLLWLMTNILIF